MGLAPAGREAALVLAQAPVLRARWRLRRCSEPAEWTTDQVQQRAWLRLYAPQELQAAWHSCFDRQDRAKPHVGGLAWCLPVTTPLTGFSEGQPPPWPLGRALGEGVDRMLACGCAWSCCIGDVRRAAPGRLRRNQPARSPWRPPVARPSALRGRNMQLMAQGVASIFHGTVTATVAHLGRTRPER